MLHYLLNIWTHCKIIFTMRESENIFLRLATWPTLKASCTDSGEGGEWTQWTWWDTFQQEVKGRPQTWASCPLLLRGSSSPSSPAGPRTSPYPTGVHYSGWWSVLPSHWLGSLPLGGRGETHDHMTGFFLNTTEHWLLHMLCFQSRCCVSILEPADVTWRVETSSTWRHLQGSLCFTQFFHSVQELSTSGLLQGVACKHARQQVSDNKMNIRGKKSKDQGFFVFFSSPTPSTRSNSAFVGLIIASTFIVPILLISLSVNESWKNLKHHQFGTGQVCHILNAKHDTVW